MLSIEDALEIVSQSVPVLPSITADLMTTQGQLLAEEIASPLEIPPFDKACMDGYAFRAEDLSTNKRLKLIGEITAGNVSEQLVGPGETMRIMTGAPLPHGADSVLQHELTSFSEPDQTVTFQQTEVTAGLNVLKQGNLMKLGEPVFSKGTKIRPQESGVLAELGKTQIQVYPRPKVAVLATGDELVPADQTPGPGQIRNTNEIMLAEQIRQMGAEPVLLGIARDNQNDLQQKIEQGLECDMLILSGGVSAGKLDLVPSVLESLQVAEIFHKVWMKPGKPVWFGAQENQTKTVPKFVFGLPGNPVSSMVCFELFVKTAIRKMMGHVAPKPEPISAVLLADHFHKGDRPTFWPVDFSWEKGEAQITPLQWRGSADLRGTMAASGMALFTDQDFTYKTGTLVDYYPWS